MKSYRYVVHYRRVDELVTQRILFESKQDALDFVESINGEFGNAGYIGCFETNGEEYRYAQEGE